jgi:AraC-like DNA-binding protein
MSDFEPGEIYRDAVAIVEEHYPQRLAAPDVAEMIGCTPVQLRHAYRSCRPGTTLRDHLREVRLNRAVELLQLWPDVSIREIGETVGYPSYNHFTSEFLRELGMTPSAYRFRALNPGLSERGRAPARGPRDELQ